jgi:phosphoserine phosphatase
MTKIILVRHGHVEGISPERFRGRADLALTPEGLRQAEATARLIRASWTPAALYASPLNRCRTTAEAIGRPFGLRPAPVPGLVDIDYGEWQGLTPDEVGRKWPEPLDTWYRAPHWAAIPGGETLQDVLARAVAALRDVIGRHPRERSSWSATTVSTASSCCTRSNCRCRAIGGSARTPVQSTRSTFRRASLPFGRSIRLFI